MVPLNHKVRKSQVKINHQLYMNDIKLFAKIKEELETPIQAVRIYSHDIGMEFGIEKYTILKMKSRKRQITDGMKLPNQGKIRTLGEKEKVKYLGILEADSLKHAEMEKNLKRSISGQ